MTVSADFVASPTFQDVASLASRFYQETGKVPSVLRAGRLAFRQLVEEQTAAQRYPGYGPLVVFGMPVREDGSVLDGFVFARREDSL